jgi:hypothetical protein
MSACFIAKREVCEAVQCVVMEFLSADSDILPMSGLMKQNKVSKI